MAPFDYWSSLNPPFSLGIESVQGSCARDRPSKSSIYTASVQYGLALGVRKGATLFGNEYLSYFCLLILCHCTEQHISVVTSTMAESNAIHGGWQPCARLSSQPTSQRTSGGSRSRAVSRPRTIVNGKYMHYYLNCNSITLVMLQ